jgi:plasmid maintenance system killer protein
VKQEIGGLNMINPNDISSLSTDEDKKEQPAVGGLSTPMVFKAPTSGKGLGQVSFPAGTLVDEQTSKGMLENMQMLLERKPFEDFQTDLQKMYAVKKEMLNEAIKRLTLVDQKMQLFEKEKEKYREIYESKLNLSQ